MNVKPSIGRVVHYVSYGTPRRPDGSQVFTSVCRAATVSEVKDDVVVGLVVQNPTGLFFHALSDGGCAYSEEHLPGSWHWPERVD